ncbi:MAG TPA: hypothetical protein VGM06_25715 [Polyangiaceae bacterium]|jgi:hypothetical protein
MSQRVVLLAFLGVALSWMCALGCTSAVADAAAGIDTVIATTDAGSDDAANVADTGSKGSAPSTISGSPLCNATTWMGCYPDDPHVSRDKDCGQAPSSPDASPTPDSTSTVACHVPPSSGGDLAAPVCLTAGNGNDGSACDSPSDCSAGYECVAPGVCRHYCCAGDCSNQNEFCDIQTLSSDPSTSVPVCMPIHGCGLLDQPTDAGTCAAGQTCSVVRTNGANGCVAVGTGQAGDSCDTADCSEGLVCLGSSGQRRCYVLCHTTGGSPECTRKQSCKGGLPLFPMPGVGICQ